MNTDQISTKPFTRRSFLRLGALGIVALPILQACTSSPPPAVTNAPAQTPQSGSTTVPAVTPAAQAAAPTLGQTAKIVWSTWAGGDAEVKLKQGTVQAFNDSIGKDKNIEASALIITNYSDYFTKVETSFAGGAAPDAVWCSLENWGKWILNHWLKDLTPLTQMEKSDSPIQVAFQQLPDYNYKFLGKVYGIPHLIQIMGVWANKEMFEKAGIPLPPIHWGDPSWTAAKLTEVAQALTKRSQSGRVEQLGTEIPCCFLGGGPGYALIQSNGGSAFDPEFTEWKMADPAAAEVVQWAYDQINKYKTAPLTQESSAGITFATGKVGMQIAWLTWPARLLEAAKGQWTPSPHPLPMFKEPTEWAHGIQIACSTQSKHPEAVIDFGRWMIESGDDMNVAMGYAAPLLDKHKALLMTNVPGQPDTTDRLKQLAKEPFLEALNYTKNIQNPYFSRYYQVGQEVWKPKINDVLIEGKITDAAKVLAGVKPAVEQILVEAKADLKNFQS